LFGPSQGAVSDHRHAPAHRKQRFPNGAIPSNVGHELCLAKLCGVCWYSGAAASLTLVPEVAMHKDNDAVLVEDKGRPRGPSKCKR